jgi:hypothetical protein
MLCDNYRGGHFRKCQSLKSPQNFGEFIIIIIIIINTLWTGDADFRMCITTVEDG